jgi:hypothetical protein
MDAREPDLHQVLRRVVGSAEGMRAEESAALVDRDGVPHDPEVGILRRAGERKVHRVVDPSQREDRVPDADEMGLA